jgi:hypothetical protein
MPASRGDVTTWQIEPPDARETRQAVGLRMDAGAAPDEAHDRHDARVWRWFWREALRRIEARAQEVRDASE